MLRQHGFYTDRPAVTAVQVARKHLGSDSLGKTLAEPAEESKV